jgi:hypothetical protein
LRENCSLIDYFGQTPIATFGDKPLALCGRQEGQRDRVKEYQYIRVSGSRATEYQDIRNRVVGRQKEQGRGTKSEVRRTNFEVKRRK